MVTIFLSSNGSTFLFSRQDQVGEGKHEIEKQVKKQPHFPESAYCTACNGHGPIFCPLRFTDDLV